MQMRRRKSRYDYYGEKGINYDPKWETFLGFWEEMKEGYADNLTIDRIDNDGNYCKENCRWAILQQQAQKREIYHETACKLKLGRAPFL